MSAGRTYLRNLSSLQVKITSADRHRNGIGGEAFIAVLFVHDGRRMVASLFEAPGHCAVYDVDELAAGNIDFGGNSWRGDDFERVLRPAVAKFMGAQ